jgi:hypothetical protein
MQSQQPKQHIKFSRGTVTFSLKKLAYGLEMNLLMPFPYAESAESAVGTLRNLTSSALVKPVLTRGFFLPYLINRHTAQTGTSAQLSTLLTLPTSRENSPF